ncbi:hypothetical protein NB689_003431 [Xanthomonas sacchari]|nr:hypothetical protein [Xanthomonas sacchari]
MASAIAAWPASASRASSTISARSARCSSWRARRMPSRSIASPPSRRPAVSTRVSSTPSRRTVSCKVSRVVPAMSVTMARSLPASALSSELLPALGGPTSTACRPSRRRRPRSASARSCVRSVRACARPARTCSPPSVSSASSAKSIAASMWMRRRISCSARSSTRRENTPSSERRAARAARRSPAAIRSAIASAWARSSLRLRKARSLNSPGRAGRAPSSQQRATRCRSSTGLPCACSSSTSSPVKLRGAGNHSAMPSSTISPCASRKRA